MPKTSDYVLDLVTKGPSRRLFNRIMNANLASIMPQAVAVWCEELGHDVRFVCYTGFEDLTAELPHDIDVLFIGAFTPLGADRLRHQQPVSSQRRGDGPGRAACALLPRGCARYFDYVLGFTDKTSSTTCCDDAAPHRPVGLQLSAARQPAALPGLRERWKFIAPTSPRRRSSRSCR